MDIIAELKNYIKNSLDCAKQAETSMKEAVIVNNYTKAHEMKICQSMHEMFAARLQRIVDGQPAFEKMKPPAIDNTDDAVEVAQRILNEQSRNNGY